MPDVKSNIAKIKKQAVMPDSITAYYSNPFEVKLSEYYLILSLSASLY